MVVSPNRAIVGGVRYAKENQVLNLILNGSVS